MARIRLTRKLALVLNGIDVSGVNVGDVFEVSEADAALLIAERWAEPVPEGGDYRLQSTEFSGAHSPMKLSGFALFANMRR